MPYICRVGEAVWLPFWCHDTKLHTQTCESYFCFGLQMGLHRTVKTRWCNTSLPLKPVILHSGTDYSL